MDVITLAIESSCDETSVAILKNGREVLANIVSTQIETHKIFGGVVPEVASRLHLEMINYIIDEALEKSKLQFGDITHIAVTKGPGLIGALIVGISAAKALSLALDIPMVGVNHIKGHICANYIAHKELEPPFISLIVSGGHTYLVEVLDYVTYKIIGQTRDDAAGESYDKVARTIGLPYPGGPEIDRAAKNGNPKAIDFPRIMLEKYSYDFSFSGLKTAVLNYVHNRKQKNEKIDINDLAASFQEAAVDVLVEKSLRLLEEKNYKKFVLAGGVAANSRLKDRFESELEKRGVEFYYPPINLSTDNAAMIGCEGYYSYINGVRDDLGMGAFPNLKL